MSVPYVAGPLSAMELCALGQLSARPGQEGWGWTEGATPGDSLLGRVGVQVMATATGGAHYGVPRCTQGVHGFAGITSCSRPWEEALLAAQGLQGGSGSMEGEVVCAGSQSSEWQSWVG